MVISNLHTLISMKGRRFVSIIAAYMFIYCYVMTQAYLHIVFSQYLLQNIYHLNKSTYIRSCCNQPQLLNKKKIMKHIGIKFLHESLYKSKLKNYNYSA